MSTKKNLIVPKLQKQNLGKVNPQKAEYLYISKEFCKEGLSQIIKDGGVQFKEIQKFVKDHQEPQYILVTRFQTGRRIPGYQPFSRYLQ